MRTNYCDKCKTLTKKQYEVITEGKLCGECYLNYIEDYKTDMDIKLGCDCGCDGDYGEEALEDLRKEVKGE